MNSAVSEGGRRQARGQDGASFAARNRYFVVLAGGVLFITFAIILLASVAISQGRKDARNVVEINAANLTSALAIDVNNSVHQADLGMLAILDELPRQKGVSWDEQTIVSAVIREDARHPETIGFRIFGPDGKLRYGFRNIVNRDADLSQSDEFKQLRDEPDAALLVMRPTVGPVAQERLIMLARRISNPDGSFGGAVYSAIPIRHLTQIFSSLELGPGGSVALYHTSFELAARFPEIKVGTTAISDQLRSIITSGIKATGFDNLSPVDGVRRTGNVRKVVGLPYYVSLALADDDWLAEWRHNRSLLILFSALLIGAVLSGMLILCRITSNRQKTADTLAASDKRMRLFFEGQIVGMAITSPQKGWLQVNDRLCQMLGYSREELGCRTWAEITHPDDLAADVKQFDRLLEGEIDQYAMEKRFIRKDERIVCTDLSVGCVRAPEGSVDYILAVLADMTEHKEALARILDLNRHLSEKTDSLAAANAELEQFSYVASHDLRQPLRMVSSYLGIIEKILDSKLDDEAEKYLQFAVTGAKKMDRLITDLLEYSRTGKTSQIISVALGDIVDSVVRNLQAVTPDGPIDISVADNLPDVMGDPTEMTRLFENLIGNAIKYRSPDRPAKVEIGCNRQADNYLVWVKDNGMGIASEHHERAFMMFQRLVPKDAFEGTGIGLAICKKIVEQSGGKIWIESVVGEGSTFFATFPVVVRA